MKKGRFIALFLVSLPFLQPGLKAGEIVHLTDTHAGGADTNILMQVRNKIQKEKNDLVIITGDVVNCAMQTYLKTDSPETTDYETAQKVFTDKNWFLIPGNHEYAYAGYASAAEFEKMIGVRHGVRDVDGWRFIGVDFGIPYSHDTFIEPKELQWLENALKEAGEKPCVLCMHQPPFFPGKSVIMNEQQLRPLLEKYPVKLILAGHTHKNRVYIAYGIPVLVTGTALNGWYSVLDIDGKKINVTIKNAIKEESPVIYSIYDADGKLDPGNVIGKEKEKTDIDKKKVISFYTVYDVEDAAIFAPPLKTENAIYFSTSLGHCWELKLPGEGKKFTEELFRASLRKIADFEGNLAFAFPDHDGRISFLSDKGQLIFSNEKKELDRIISCQPIVYGDMLIAGTLAGTVIFYDLKKHEIVKEVNLETALSVSGIAADKERIYICSLDETLRALNLDGSPCWKARLSDKNYSVSIYPSLPLLYEDIVFVTSNDKKAMAFSATDGSLLWEDATGTCNTFSPILFRNRIVVGNRKGILADFNPRSGKKNILCDAPGNQIISGTVKEDSIFLNCWNGILIRWTTEKTKTWKYTIPDYYNTHSPIPLDKEVLLPCWNGRYLSFPIE